MKQSSPPTPHLTGVHHSTFLRDNDQYEARAVRDRPSERSNSSLALTFTAFFIFAVLLVLHLSLDEPLFFLPFDSYDSALVPTTDSTPLDNWIAEPLNESNSPRLEYQIIPASNNLKSSSNWTFVLLHGLGDYRASDSFRLREALVQLRPDLFESMRFIIPSAGHLPITVFDGQHRSAWYDIKNWTDLHQDEDFQHMKQNVDALHRIIQANHIVLNRTIIGGFSQGAVMSLLLSLSLETPPAGVVMLSGYTPIPEKLKLLLPSSYKNKNKSKTSLFWLHGELDPYFNIKIARNQFKFLKKLVRKYSIPFFSFKFHSIPLLDHKWSIFQLKILVHSLEKKLLSQK